MQTDEENNGNMYLTLVPNDESKDKLKKYKEIWRKIKVGLSRSGRLDLFPSLLQKYNNNSLFDVLKLK